MVRMHLVRKIGIPLKLLANLLIKSVLVDDRERGFSSVFYIIEIVQDCSVPVIENKIHLSQISTRKRASFVNSRTNTWLSIFSSYYSFRLLHLSLNVFSQVSARSQDVSLDLKDWTKPSTIKQVWKKVGVMSSPFMLHLKNVF